MPRYSHVYQIVYFPYLGLTEGEELSFGELSVWGASELKSKVNDGPVRKRVQALLDGHREISGKVDKSRPVRGIGVVSGDEVDFRELIPDRTDEVQELRYALFLACLSSDLNLHGPNAGHSLRTAENFSFISQGFSLDRPYISETSGVLVRRTMAGYKIGEVQFPTPSHVPRPYRWAHDAELIGALDHLRRSDRKLYRRVIDAAALFIESYHNTHSVDIRARVLLQAAAFEVLLDLPEYQQRKVFKDRVEQYASESTDRRYHYKYETRGGKKPESRTRKGIWADRFYTLRNHIIHGERVRASDYRFRGKQHHVAIAPVFFVHIIRRLLEASLADQDPGVRFYSRISWHEPPADHDGDEEDIDEPGEVGFRAVTDWPAYIVGKLAEGEH